VALPHRSDGALAADLGAAHTEALSAENGSHRHLTGQGAIGWGGLTWLQLGAALSGRYDSHPDDEQGADDSWSGLPSARVRAIDDGGEFAWGAEIAAEFPGSDAPSVEFAATTVNLVALAAYEPRPSGVTLAANVGYRLDNSGHAAPDLTRLRQGDRVALGLNDYDAILLRLGAGYQLGKGLLMGEFSTSALLGTPNAATSPKRVALGYRHELTPTLQAEAFFHANLNRHPEVAADAPLIAVESRVGGWLGLRMTFGEATPPAPPPAPPPSEKTVAPADPVEVAASAARVSGLVQDSSGTPLPQVDITARVGDKEFAVVTDSDGKFRFDSLPFGEGVLQAATVDYEPVEVALTLGGDGSAIELAPIEMKLQALGAQLQGLVQSFGGQPVVGAKIQLTPPGDEHTTGDDGRFTIIVNPGRYKVVISAAGYAAQTHVVSVDERAVVVLNADLRKAP
jgi:hypothetical protein